MLRDARRLAEQGVAVHWLHPRSKRPKGNDWSIRPVASVEKLESTYRDGDNIGIRLGEPSEVHGYHLHCLDVDIRDPALAHEAFAKLAEYLPNWKEFPRVKSGSGGKSRHVYFVTDESFSSKKLAHSAKRVEIAGKKHWGWEIELFGTGKQVACPPSIHPDTGKPYKWLQEIDFFAIEHGFGPVVPSSDVDSWFDGREDDEEDRSSTRSESSSSSLSQMVARKPLDIDTKEVRGYLRDIDHDEWCVEYEGWLKVGMALHHQYEGQAEGLEEWHRFSKKADNYEAEALDAKWKSFSTDKKRRPVSFKTIINAGHMKRFQRESQGADDDTEIDESDQATKWRGQLDINDKGSVKPHLDNVTLLTEHDERIRGVIAYNLFTERTVLRKKAGFKEALSEKRQKYFRQLTGPLWRPDKTERRNGKQFTDAHMNDIRVMFAAPVRRGGYGCSVTDRDLYAARDIVARKNEFHPIRQYLEGLSWDGQERLDRLFIDWLGCPDDEYHRQIARLFCLAAIARVYFPGHKFDFAVILEGPQGIGKSTFIRSLAKDWFTELRAGLDDPKKSWETMNGHWIIELPELSQFNRSEVESVKAFFSSNEDTFRAAYGRDSQTVKRQQVFMGSTNNEQYLKDETGNRRFWPAKVLIERIDIPGFRAAVDQIWAEAYAAYLALIDDGHQKENLPLYLRGKSAERFAKQIQESRRVESQSDVWVGMISAWADEPVHPEDIQGHTRSKFEDHDRGSSALVKREIICALEVWCEVLGGRVETYARAAGNQVVRALQRLDGWEYAGVQRCGIYGRQKAFRRVADSRSDTDLFGG